MALADGDLPLTDLARIGLPSCQLAVASACQTAMPDASRSDDAYSVAAILLVVGAACAIASLWPVGDLATALLMMRLYQQIRGEAEAPPLALRRAQTWLRELTRADAGAVIAENELLRLERVRQRSLGRDLLPEGSHPFADPIHWAAFIAMGA